MKKIFYKTLLTFFVVTFFLLAPVGVSAQSSYYVSNLLPTFGGLIYFVKPCQCPTPGFLVSVSFPVPATVIFIPGSSVLYPNFRIFYPGNWALGLYTPAPASCGMVQNGYCTAQIPAQGYITIVGTS